MAERGEAGWEGSRDRGRGWRPVPGGRRWLGGDSVDVAPGLLGKLLARDDGRAGRIIEVEAYRGEEDPASHAFRGPTARNATMFGRPGLLYVYFTYGMHWCANVVCGPEGTARAVLVRALEPVAGTAAMRAARGGGTDDGPVGGGPEAPAWRAASDRDLCRGPARLCQALGLDRNHDGADLITGDRGVWLADDGTPPPVDPVVTVRVGLSAGADLPWRWAVPGHRGVSRAPGAARPAGNRRAAGGAVAR